MHMHANAKLGVASRYALVAAIEGGLSLKQAAAAFQRLAGDGSPVVASLVRRGRGGSANAVVFVRSLQSTASVAPAARARIDGGPGTDALDGGRGTDVCANGETNTNCEA